jgi:hypothetical protein
MPPISGETMAAIRTITAISSAPLTKQKNYSKRFEAFKYMAPRQRHHDYLLNGNAVFAVCQCQKLPRMILNDRVLAIQTISRSYCPSEGPKSNRIRGNFQKKLNHAPIAPAECIKTINPTMPLEV